ncbi:MAG: alkaline shock response membrane anchor protein AmaP [Actinobacteria bacterium]|nr:alkaline shock response membrane anchor protein AmaP [Actinomycetota bacterium]
MNIFNRIVVILILLSLILWSLTAIFDVFFDFISFQKTFAKVVAFTDILGKFGLAFVLLLILIISIVLLVLEFYVRKPSTVRISGVKSGMAVMSLSSVSEHVRQDVSKIGNVKNVKVRVSSKAGGAVIRLLLGLAEGIDVPAKMAEVNEVVKDTTINKLGVKLTNMKVTVVHLAGEPAGAQIRQPEPKPEAQVDVLPKE